MQSIVIGYILNDNKLCYYKYESKSAKKSNLQIHISVFTEGSESNALGRKHLVGSPHINSQPLSILRKGGDIW